MTNQIEILNTITYIKTNHEVTINFTDFDEMEGLDLSYRIGDLGLSDVYVLVGEKETEITYTLRTTENICEITKTKNEVETAIKAYLVEIRPALEF